MKVYVTENDSAPYSVAIADFNNDIRLDIVVTNYETDQIVVLLLGHGDGISFNSVKYSTGSRSRPYMNEDDWMDIVVACYHTDHVEILMQRC